MYPQYKAHRREHPPSLAEAVCRILAVVDALGIPVLSVPGVEADDVVGTLALKAQQDGFGSVVIVSTDKVSSSTSGAVCCMQGTPSACMVVSLFGSLLCRVHAGVPVCQLNC